MAKKTASDLAAQICELAETLTKTAQTDVRRGIADAFLAMVKNPEDLRPYLHNEDVPTRGIHGEQIGVTKYRSYLPEVDEDEFEFTPDVLRGIRLVCAALKDIENFEY